MGLTTLETVRDQPVGEKLGISFQQIQKYEKGVNRVSTGRLIQLCQALQCDLADLADLGGIKPAKITPASTFAAGLFGTGSGSAYAQSAHEIDRLAPM